MELKKSWWIWILVILLLVIIFPKTCGRTDYVSSVIKYSCTGLQAPFFSNINDKYNWCYGICFEKTIKKESSQTNETTKQSTPAFVSDIYKSLKGVLYPLVIILVIIGILKYISGLKGKKSNIIIYRKPDR